jgi:uncharacterized membrane protein
MSSSNPFEAPEARGSPTHSAAVGTLDPVAAVIAGWEATKRNIGGWLVVSIVGYLLAALAGITVVGLFVVCPVLLWGAVYFCLNADKGEGQFGDLFAGFSRYGDALGSMLGYIVLSIIVGLPGSALSYINMALQMSGEGSEVLSFLAPVVSLVWTLLVTIRLLYAPFFMVEQGMGPVAGLKASWEATREQKLNNFILVLLFIPVCLAGFLALCVGIIVSIWVCYAAMAAGYRQMVGPVGASPG